MVQNYSSKYDVKCQLDACKTYPIITDSVRGEVLCGGCGLVLVQNMADFSHESHGYTQEEFLTQSRTGPPTSLTMHDKGLSTIIGNNVDSSGHKLSSRTKFDFVRLRVWDNRSKSKNTATLSKAFTLLNGMKTKLAIPDNVVENAAYIYRKALNKKLVRGRTTSAMIGSALYAACRETNTPRTLMDIAVTMNIKKGDLAACYRLLVKELDLKIPVVDSVQNVARIASNVGISEKTKRYTFEILRKAEQANFSAGKLPIGLAATALYIACSQLGEYHSQRELADAANTTEVTIRNLSSGFRKLLKLR